MLARRRIQNHAVAIGVPLIPIIAGRRFANLVLRLLSRTLNRNELAFSHTRATLRSSDFDFAFAHEHFRMIVARYQNAKAGIALLGADGNVRSINFRTRVAVTEHGVIRHSARQLNLNLRARQLRDICLGMLRESKRVGIVELNFGARSIASRNTVARQHRRIDRSCRPTTGITALRRNIAMHQADACHAIIFNRRRSVVCGIIRTIIIVEARIHRPTSARALIVRALLVLTLINCRRLLIHRLLIVVLPIIRLIGRPLIRSLFLIVLHGYVRGRLRILVLPLIVLILVAILCENGAWNRHRQS